MKSKLDNPHRSKAVKSKMYLLPSATEFDGRDVIVAIGLNTSPPESIASSFSNRNVFSPIPQDLVSLSSVSVPTVWPRSREVCLS